MQEEILDSMRLPRRVLRSGVGQLYRVYSTRKDFVSVEAETAAEAFRMSGLGSCFRIVKETVYVEDILSQSMIEPSEQFFEISNDPMHTENPPGARRIDGMLVIHAPDDEGVESVAPDKLFKAMSLSELGQKKEPKAVMVDEKLSNPAPLSNTTDDQIAAVVAQSLSVQESAPVEPAADNDALTQEEIEKLLNGDS